MDVHETLPSAIFTHYNEIATHTKSIGVLITEIEYFVALHNFCDIASVTPVFFGAYILTLIYFQLYGR